ncbi:MAG: aldehyde dehydrogenase family protein [Nitriliruptoraceae bacterium]
MATRLQVPKTYKLAIGGAFPRSESGRTFDVVDADGSFVANASKASRKDVRDAVVAARSAQPGWSGATAYNRGQVLYRVAELLDGRREQFADEIVRLTGVPRRSARTQVTSAIDMWVWYAGWSDKFAQVSGAANPVAGPYFNISVPEPTGVVAVIAPQDDALAGLVAAIAPVIVSGNTVVVVPNTRWPLPAITLAEVLATSDVPGGVVNVLTGDVEELTPVLAGHLDVNAIDLGGVADRDTTDWETAAAENVKRVVRTPPTQDADGPARILAFCETKTVWHPKGW